jgi:hypothetical protein
LKQAAFQHVVLERLRGRRAAQAVQLHVTNRWRMTPR